MTTEIQMLAWAVALGLAHILLAAGAATAQRGLRWNAGNREAALPPLAGMAGRLERAQRNFLETFPLFAAVALAVVVAGRADAHTALGAQIYFWARLAYLPIYAIGIPYLRSLVWAISAWGLIQVGCGLF
ncbi:MAPEG family protein [Pseudoxanthomonas mexicana]|uniref:MAPEG family protein n=1 Tax=Pseudoxanthomonas mexicana TaxID=128785 RepID=UPI00398B91D2